MVRAMIAGWVGIEHRYRGHMTAQPKALFGLGLEAGVHQGVRQSAR
jgi:hypothetical protein